MKKISKENKIVLLLIILFILAGIITLLVEGFEKTAIYEFGTRIEVYIPQGYEKQDIINIAKESFSENKFSFEEVEKLNQVAAIKIKKYSEEELNKFKTTICEKYEIEEDALELHEVVLPTTRIRTVVAPYVFPIVLVTILTLIYVLFRNIRLENKWKNILKIIFALALVLGIYFSLILVLRIPFGNYTMPIALGVYILTLIVTVNNIKNNK